LRTGELCSLNVQDVDTDRQELFVSGKGARERRIPVPGGVWTELLAYLVERKVKRGPLFRTNAKHRRVSAKDVCDVVREVVKRAGINGEGKVTAKTLRHSYATHLMDQGVDLGVIASLMGHRSITETGVYLHVLPGKREAAVKKLERRNRDRKDDEDEEGDGR
jgi:site-specific recombinase XerD